MDADDGNDVPERAIRAFEAATGLNVCLYDQAQSFLGLLPPERFEHLGPICRMVKQTRMAACKAFEGGRCAPAVQRSGTSAIKRCHAGLVEWIAPLRLGDAPLGVVFAGACRPGRGLQPDLADATRMPDGPWSPQVRRLRAVGQENALVYRELLLQLAERLSAWAGRRQARRPRRQTAPIEAPAPATPAADAARRHRIERFLAARHQREIHLSDLAQDLGLGPDRAGHVVRELYGAGFSDLLARHRVGTARTYLRDTALPVRRIGKLSGFRSTTRFFAQFRRITGMTPSAYRLGDDGAV